MKQKKNSESPVYKHGHFTVVTKADKNRVNVCVYCDKTYSITTSTGSLLYHLRNIHQIEPETINPDKLRQGAAGGRKSPQPGTSGTSKNQRITDFVLGSLATPGGSGSQAPQPPPTPATPAASTATKQRRIDENQINHLLEQDSQGTNPPSDSEEEPAAREATQERQADSDVEIVDEADNDRQRRVPPVNKTPVSRPAVGGAFTPGNEQRRPSNAKSKATTPTIHKFFYKKLTPQDQVTFNKLIATWLATDMLPPHIVTLPGFQTLVTALFGTDLKIPSAATIKANMKLLADEIKGKLQEQLDQVDDVALTTDCWVSRATESYITTTAHFIDEDFDLQSATISTKGITGSHDANFLQENLEVCAAEWNLEGKISATTHDNAGNISNAVDMSDVLGESNRCFAHTSNLSVMESLSTDHVSSLISKCSALVGHFKHSTPANEALHETQRQLKVPVHELIQCVKTRWNSYYYMFERLIEQKIPIRYTLARNVDKSYTNAKRDAAMRLDLSESEWTDLQELCDIFKPFAQSLVRMCADTYATLSSVRPFVYSLLNKLEPHDTDSRLMAQTKRILYYRTATRFDVVPKWHRGADGNELPSYSVSPLLQEDPDFRAPHEGPRRNEKVSVAQIASFLDPRFKLMAFETPRTRVEIKDHVRDLYKAELERFAGVNEDEVRQEDEFDVDLAEAMSLGVPEDEFDSYVRENVFLNSRDNPLDWWRQNKDKFPTMARLARRYLCIPATSAPSERVFSAAGNLITPRRNCLLPETVEMSIFIYQNVEERKLKKAAIEKRKLKASQRGKKRPAVRRLDLNNP